MKQFQLSEVENLRIENSQLKARELHNVLNQIKADYEKTITDFCTRVSQKPEDIENLNLESGMVSFKEEKKEEPKAEELKAEETETK